MIFKHTDFVETTESTRNNKWIYENKLEDQGMVKLKSLVDVVIFVIAALKNIHLIKIIVNSYMESFKNINK